jgi:glycosyltransferase involved in cell wall biosynthesis
MEKIKLIHVITRFDKGGSAEHAFLTICGLSREKYEITLIKGSSLESKMTLREQQAVENNVAETERKGVKIVTLPSLIRRLSPFHDLMSLIALIRIFRRERPHIVHTHTSKAGIIGRWAAFVAGVPLIVHTPHGHVFWGYFGKIATRLFILAERVTSRVTDRLIMITDCEREDHLAMKVSRPGMSVTIHSGIELGLFDVKSPDPAGERRRLNLPQDASVVGAVGRLTAVKGHRYLIEAAARIIGRRKNTFFVFLGDGELLSELQTLASDLGILANLRFPGWRSDVSAVMSTFDVFALPSINEGMGKVLVEAMAMGIPIVASDVGGVPDLVSHGTNGFLVPVANADGLADAIERLLRDGRLREQMGRQGREIAPAFGADSMVRKIEHLYDSLLEEKNLTSGVLHPC